MKITLKNNKEIARRACHIKELIKKYKGFLNGIDDYVFENRGIHLDNLQLSYIALSVEKVRFMNRDKSKEELTALMSVAGVKATCELFCIAMPDEMEIDEKTLRVINSDT